LSDWSRSDWRSRKDSVGSSSVDTVLTLYETLESKQRNLFSLVPALGKVRSRSLALFQAGSSAVIEETSDIASGVTLLTRTMIFATSASGSELTYDICRLPTCLRNTFLIYR